MMPVYLRWIGWNNPLQNFHKSHCENHTLCYNYIHIRGSLLIAAGKRRLQKDKGGI